MDPETLATYRPHPTVRAPDLAARVGRETADFKKDVRKLKELGLTESLDIGYLLSPRGEAVVDDGGPGAARALPRRPGRRCRGNRRTGHAGAARGRGSRRSSRWSSHRAADLAAMHGVGPMAIGRLREALAEQGSRLAGD